MSEHALHLTNPESGSVPRRHAVGTATPPRVERATRADIRRWDEFVETRPEASFFHLFAWRDIIENVFHHRTWYLLARRGDTVTGILPLAQVKSLLFGHALVSLPFCVYAGIVADDAESADALVAEAEAIAADIGAGHLELRQTRALHPQWPCQDLYVTFRKPILPEVEANMLAIPRKQRAMVRKGIKAGLTGAVDTDMDRFFELYADNVHRHGTPALPKRYFTELLDAFGARVEPLIVGDVSGKAVSGVLSFYFRDEVLPYYAGDVPAARGLAANDFKYWELMRRACERGVRVFDYGRSKRGTGSFDFKKNWGFEPQGLHYEYRLYRRATVPQQNPSNPKYRLFIDLWRRLPRPVVNRLGPFIVRNLG
ncbi:MAG: hypothetical protein IOMNBAOH_02206 [Rhodocyclaceae bacterium]|nr:hypothetical protein [Rhodocyclaceae bacterium]